MIIWKTNISCRQLHKRTRFTFQTVKIRAYNKLKALEKCGIMKPMSVLYIIFWEGLHCVQSK